MELNTRGHESQGISFITVPSLWEGGTRSHHKPGHGRCEGGAALLPSWHYKPARTSFQNMICCSHTHPIGTKIHLPTVWNIPPHPPCPMLGTLSRTVSPPPHQNPQLLQHSSSWESHPASGRLQSLPASKWLTSSPSGTGHPARRCFGCWFFFLRGENNYNNCSGEGKLEGPKCILLSLYYTVVGKLVCVHTCFLLNKAKEECGVGRKVKGNITERSPHRVLC